MEKIRILVVGDDYTTQRFQNWLVDDEFDVRTGEFDEDEVLNMITRTNARIVMLEDDGSGSFYRCCQQIYMLRPRTIPVVVMSDRSQEKMDRLLQTGVHHSLPDTLSADEFVQSLKAIYLNESTRLVSMENTSGEHNKSKIVMVYGAKDGIGKTSFAANLAVSLAQEKQKVAIIDLDLQYGDVNVFFGIESRTTISELVQEQVAVNIDVIRQHMALHASGVNILCAPRSPEFAEGITGDQIEKILAAIRSYYDYVILDMPPVFNDINVSCIDASSSILFLTGADISSLRNSRKALYLLLALTRKEKIKLLIGKERENEIKPAVIAKTLEFPVNASLPYDHKTIVSSLNLGKPIVTSTPGAKYSKAVKSICAMLNAGENDGLTSKSVMPAKKKKVFGR